MPDRVIRDELLESDRWVDLPTDTDRLAYIGLRLKSDDFGNIDAGFGRKRLFKLFQSFTEVKVESGAAVVLERLVSADLIRFYEVSIDGETKEFLHLPRSRPTGSYLVRKCPPSPWCNPDIKLGKHVRSVRNQGHAKNLPVMSLERQQDVSQGVGVGVGVGEGKGEGKGKILRAREQPVDKSGPPPKTPQTAPAAQNPTADAVVPQSPEIANSTPPDDLLAVFGECFKTRYGTPPVVNSYLLGQLKRFATRLGADAGAVIRHYFGNNYEFYVRHAHSAAIMLADAEKLHMEWKTGRLSKGGAPAVRDPGLCKGIIDEHGTLCPNEAVIDGHCRKCSPYYSKG